jgi:hypothetical protein
VFMLNRYYKILFVAIFAIMAMPTAQALLLARRRRRQEQQQKLGQGMPCSTEKACTYSKACQCYCSAVGGFRNKDETDRPVYVAGDEYKHKGKPVNCFCKPWDKDAFPRGVPG